VTRASILYDIHKNRLSIKTTTYSGIQSIRPPPSVVPSSHTYSCNDNSSANLPLNLGPPLNNVKLCEPVKTTACLLSTSNKLCDRPLFGDVLLSTSKSTYRATSRAFVCQFQLDHFKPTTYGGIVNKTTMYSSTSSTTTCSASSPGKRLLLDFSTNIIHFYESGLFSKGYRSGVLGCRHIHKPT
jgi:hypothetical protein